MPARKLSKPSCEIAARRNSKASSPGTSQTVHFALFSSIFSIHQIHTFAPSRTIGGGSVALLYQRWPPVGIAAARRAAGPGRRRDCIQSRCCYEGKSLLDGGRFRRS